jgi:hypothetical protein
MGKTISMVQLGNDWSELILQIICRVSGVLILGSYGDLPAPESLFDYIFGWWLHFLLIFSCSMEPGKQR